MLTRYFIVFAFAVRLLSGQPSFHAQLDEAGFRSAVQRWADGLPVRDNNRAGAFAIGHEDVAIPILIDAIKVKLSDKQTANSKQTEDFIQGAVDLATYHASPRAVDGVADLCQVDRGRCPWMVNHLLSQGIAQQHPFGTAYDIVERYPNLREHVLRWTEAKTQQYPDLVPTLARELLKREKAGHPIDENDAILSGLAPAIREAVRQVVENDRIEQRQRR